MASVQTTYECPACRGRFAVTVFEVIEPPDTSTAADRLSPEVAALVAAAAPPASEVARRKADFLAEQAREVLRHATCPGCGARNPEGVAARRRERSLSRWGTATFFALVAGVSVYVPWMAWIPPGLSLLIVGLSVVMRAPGRGRRLALGLPIPVAMAAFVAVMPRYAYAVPALMAVQVALLPGADSDDSFARAATRLRFETTPFRG